MQDCSEKDTHPGESIGEVLHCPPRHSLTSSCVGCTSTFREANYVHDNDDESALYQLHLVKAETARAFIPKDFKLVEAFGYTLGGFFLANYEDSPVGKFDELVVIAGIVWNPPTSCAGRTEYNPDLLKYSCQIECRLRAVSPAKVLGPSPFALASNMDGEITSEYRSSDNGDRDSEDIKRNLSISVMLSKPILALEFNCLKMTVDAPTVVSQSKQV
ncbi:hypothetical protein PHJA_001659000 [Phtheirospermum japonicum]|uniref:Protein NEOXANTHIN-DEFICIENT 1 n=1 Tax=Phtheirospermum japonicum TaxID=374723 RepID=A0A830C7Q0_9LAMI|nr:hypothetical protein PHJA_001659000 [Phtheirospermum japonicum]